MANKKATMTDLRLLIREFIKGTSKRKICEKLNLSRTSVDVYIGRRDASRKSAKSGQYPPGELVSIYSCLLVCLPYSSLLVNITFTCKGSKL